MTTTLRVLYNLAHAPASFDFATFLAGADCARQLMKMDGIDLVICKARYRTTSERDLTTDPTEKDWRIQNIILPICHLLPAMYAVTVTAEPQEARKFDYPPLGDVPYLPPAVKRLVNHGADPHVYKSPPFAKYFVEGLGSYVTLTPRISKHFPVRNCDPAGWTRFAAYLTGRGFKVIVVPDVENLGAMAAEPIGVLCATNHSVRMALYERAKFNIFGATGVTVLLAHSRIGHLIFDQTRGNVFPPERWEKMYNMRVGENWAWATPNQKLAWKDSSYENLVEEFEKYQADMDFRDRM